MSEFVSSLRAWGIAVVLVAGGLTTAHLAQVPAAPTARATETSAAIAARARGALADTTGEAELTGLRERVEVIRDRWGVPHIYAQTVDDLFFAQGFVVAQDRLWQLDVWRRAAMGELAEVLGPSFVSRDTSARLLRYRGDMEREWRAYGPDTRRIVEAFVAGVNAQIDLVTAAPDKLPIEFLLTDSRPERWSPEVVISRMAGYLMTRNARAEVQRARLAARVGVTRVREFLPPEPDVAIELPRGLDLADVTDDVLRIAEGVSDGLRSIFPAPGTAASLPTPWPLLADARRPSAFSRVDPLWTAIARARDDVATIGSNNWVVAGSRSATGRPLLANDPHRAIQLPSLRYTVHLNGPGWNVIGAGEPALPGVAAGHNDRVAFGFTIVGIDQQDLYVETLDPSDPSRVVFRGSSEPIQVEQTVIEVRGEAPRTVALRFTRHGPVLHVDEARRRAYALRWVGLEPGTAGYLASLSLNTARNWDEFRTAVARWAVPSENLLYADVDGNIGWAVGGLTPVRRGWHGLLPVPGHEGRYEWDGFLPPEQLPHAFNPANGTIATANHNILPAGYPHELGYDWSPPHRYERIVEALGTRERWDVGGFERLQHDESSLPARAIVDALRVASISQRADGADRALAVRMLTGWDGTLSASSAPAALYELWLPHLQRDFALAVYQPRDRANAPERLPLEALLRRLRAPTRDDLALLAGPALDRAVADARARMGSDVAQWAWGRLHQAVFEHPLATTDARRPVLNLPPVSRGGDATTLNNTGHGATQVHGASYRQVIDVADWDRSTMTNVPGQSGQPASPHYGDLLPLWAEGRYHQMAFSRAAVERHAAARLVLRPAGTAPSATSPGAAGTPPSPAPAPGEAAPRLPPFAGTLVNYDRHGEFTAACARDLGGGETRRGARVIPNTHVWVLHRETIRELGSSPGSCDPAWSPDGARLAVVTPNGLWTYSPTLEEPRQLAETSLPDPPKHPNDYTAFSTPRWSPDGRRLAYLVGNGQESWVEVVDTESTRRLLRTDPGVTSFSWSPDATSLTVDGRTVVVPR